MIYSYVLDHAINQVSVIITKGTKPARFSRAVGHIVGYDRYSGHYIAVSYGLTLHGWHTFTTAGVRMKQKSHFKCLPKTPDLAV